MPSRPGQAHNLLLVQCRVVPKKLCEIITCLLTRLIINVHKKFSIEFITILNTRSAYPSPLTVAASSVSDSRSSHSAASETTDVALEKLTEDSSVSAT